ncbi:MULTISPECIES: MetQ/NlpA family ABC transporter substrate-binding protein [unclassified Leptolyngbya]|uniref:MetQ/NlpA family ABC transporter substrate-binding protein n=1 Tax=unclassified Leptolyngbya TaxID=2650499 RepID=UPI00168731DB|nr:MULTISPECIES: MetQ/NlpA family ABC transporter substrate-binding protein [unclassified Leptolyngbya]MBD1909900.1 MetQ/NlpA family ABC transporter substrate-binding protein [Leptolyngbya sp. FACHB-8]MBD2158636.1 MetQ/NlpA family ABC transporter substrate-binding protein [Leptolyngbya sp. FACHB-16]
MKPPSHSPISTHLNRRFFLVAAGSFAATTLFAGCGTNTSESASSETSSGASSASAKLTVGATPVPHAEILRFVKDNLAANEGLDLEIVEFTDYVQPNLALNDKQLDANFFQHVPYMEDFAKERGLDLVAVVPVHIEPLGLYSRKIKSLSEVSDGAQLAVPNDATNLGRSLKLLQDNQLVQLKSGVGVEATSQDVEANPKNIKLVELEAAQLPRALDDVELAIINGNYAIETGLNPTKDALALEKAEGNPYANILAVIKGRETDPNIQKLATLLTSPETKKFIQDKYQGAVIPA